MGKLAHGNCKAAQLSPIEALILAWKGRRDGKIGLPRQDERGGWHSPQHSKEAKAYYEFTAKEWAQTEAKNSELHRETAAMERNARNKQAQLGALLAQSPAGPNLSFAYQGEAGIDPAILRSRRQSEHSRANGKYFSKCEELRAYIEQAQDKISENAAAIAESENITRLICERAKQRTEQRISAYWHGLLCANTDKSVPASPQKIEESGAERLYFSRHSRIADGAAPMREGGEGQ
jgi:hypothetical protein